MAAKWIGVLRSPGFLFGLLPAIAMQAIAISPHTDAAEAPIITAPAASEAAAPADKSGYTLLNPTPASLLRDFNSNRPDTTESPTTIDAGHVQVESSFVEYTRDSDHGVTTDQFSVFPTTIRLGVLNNFEVDVAFNPYLNSLTHGAIPSHRQQGTDDTQIRGTVNLWGNDGGSTADGAFAFVSLPTGSGGFGSHYVAGGACLPVAFQLPAGFAGGAMIECDVTRNASNDGYGVNFLHTLSIEHDLLPHLAGYVEYAGIAPVSLQRTYLAVFDTGLTYALADNLQVDMGINIGLSSHASDYTLFTGLTFRH
jgi:hypothetical protein